MVHITWEKIRHSLTPSTRCGIAVMLFMMCLIAYVVRVNLSINIISMVAPSDNSTTTASPTSDPQYNWGTFEQGLLLSSYFWGYMLTSLFGGVLAEALGAKEVAGYTMAICVLLTALSPVLTKWDYWALLGARILIGFFSGAIYPCCHTLISKWAPSSEKGSFVAALMGGTFGTVVSWPLGGVILEALGWQWAFYIFAIICGLVTLLWFVVVANSPSEHKWISEEEKKYIEDSLSEGLSKSRTWPPVLSLILSFPFWALLFLHFGNMWGLYFLITAAPKFMSQVLGFNLAAAGFVSSLPYLARLIMSFTFGVIGDLIRKRNYLSVTKTRKYFCLFSHFIPGALLILLAFVNQNAYGCVAIITLSLGFNGAATLTNLQNSQDLAPNYAGVLYGIINCFGTLPGIFSPMIVGFFTKENEKLVSNWRPVFFIGAAAYIIPAVFFIIFGSGKIQKWNYTEAKKKDGENS